MGSYTVALSTVSQLFRKSNARIWDVAETIQAIEVLSTRLETDRSLIRHLLGAAQLWKSLVDLLDAQSNLFHSILVDSSSRWLDGAADISQIQREYDAQLEKIVEHRSRLQADLVQETDNLIQRITNLISIDEGYRSRDQNESIK